MSPTDWMVMIAGAALTAFELWFFLGKPSGRGKTP
jgi:hypothetical protein